MKRWDSFSRKDIYALGGIVMVTLVIIISCFSRESVYGSVIDWGSQHYTIPEYFRTLFYDSGSLIPSYAANAGGGENIFVFSYYGLLSPLILLSYLLPFVPMGQYIIAMAISCVVVSEILMYTLVRKNYDTRVTAMVTLFFAVSAPLILNSHKHVMFIDYMPFLLLALHGTDRYFRTGKRSLLAISVFLMTMCNYFFAVASVFAVLVYGLFVLLRNRDKKVLRSFIAFGLVVAAGVFAAAVLLIPTALTLLAGRDPSALGTPLRAFLPTIRFDRLTYDGVAMGASAFGVFSAVYFLINGRKHERFAAGVIIGFAVFPVMIYILNGTLYFDPKVLFPFLPILLLLTAEMLKKVILSVSAGKLGRRLIPALAVFSAISFISFLICEKNYFSAAYLADAVIVIISLLAVLKLRKKRFMTFFFCIPFAACIGCNHYDALVDKKSYDTVNSESVKAFFEELPQDELYRTAVDTERLYAVNKIYSTRHYQDTIYSSIHSRDYNSFYFNEMYNENEFRNSALTARSGNIIFNCYMGNRFYISAETKSYPGSRLIRKTDDGFYLYENEYAFPMIYFSNKLMSETQYRTLNYPDNIEALMRYAVVPDEAVKSFSGSAGDSTVKGDGSSAGDGTVSGADNNASAVSGEAAFKSSMKKVDIGDIFDIEGSTLEGNIRHIVNNTDGDICYSKELPESVKGKILLLCIYVHDPVNVEKKFLGKNDIRIKINGVKNTLTDPDWKYKNCNNYFEYVISDTEDRLDIVITGKDIKIEGLTAYTLDPEYLKEMKGELKAFVPDMDKTHDDTICGSITADSDGFVSTSLVWQKGFTVTVDGEKVTPVKTDTAFLGFPVSRGQHSIKISFTAPGLKAGKAVSAVGLMVIALFLITDIILGKIKRKTQVDL